MKVFYEPEGLARRLAGLGWRFTVSATDSYFLYGYGEADAATERTEAVYSG